jgi:hypothetical protein
MSDFRLVKILETFVTLIWSLCQIVSFVYQSKDLKISFYRINIILPKIYVYKTLKLPKIHFTENNILKIIPKINKKSKNIILDNTEI